jgi:hypothetical protein
MLEEKNAIDQFLAEVIFLENRRQGLIRDLLKQRDDAIRGFDAELAKLGHTPQTLRRNHHRKTAETAGPKLTPKPQKVA